MQLDKTLKRFLKIKRAVLEKARLYSSMYVMFTALQA